MRDLIWRLFHHQSKFWNFMGSLSAITGLVCFALSSTFKKLFGEWDFLHFLIYLSVSSVILLIALLARRIRVSGNFLLKGHMVLFNFGLTCLYSVVRDKTLTGKPDALSTISYGSFALMSLSMSRKFELGFETGLFSFFLACFSVQLIEISGILSVIAVGFSYVLINFRSYSDSQVEIGSTGPHDFHCFQVDPANEYNNAEEQHSTRIGEVSRESLSGDSQQSSEEHDTCSVLSHQAEVSNQDDVSSGKNLVTNENGWINLGSPMSQLISGTPPSEFSRDITGDAIQLNPWQLQVCDGVHSMKPRLMYDPLRRVWLRLEEAALVFRMVEEADLEVTKRPEMRVLVKPAAKDSGDDSSTSSPTSVLPQLRTDADEAEQEEEDEEEEKEPLKFNQVLWVQR